MVDDRADDRSEEQDSFGSQTNFGVIQERVKNIENRLCELAVSLKETNIAVHKAALAIEQVGKTKWGLLIAAATLFCLVTGGVWGVIWALVLTPINDKAIDLKSMELLLASQERLDVQHLEDELKNKAENVGIEKEMDKLDLRIQQLNKDLGYGPTVPPQRAIRR